MPTLASVLHMLSAGLTTLALAVPALVTPPVASAAPSGSEKAVFSEGAAAPPTLVVWHGSQQRVGHLGDAQDDFNLMGNVSDADGIASLTYRLNGGAARALTVGSRSDGFGDGRRLAATGDFNADIPISQLRMGANTVVLRAVDNLGTETIRTVTITRQTGSYPLPVSINWSAVSNPQDIGQYVDGQWSRNGNGLRTQRVGYDRLFLIGERTWQDYEVTVPVTIHGRQSRTGPYSGGAGVGIIMRFAGHVVGGHRNWPNAQPKWGYQPFGAIGLLKHETGQEYEREFFRGDTDQAQHFGGRVRVSLGSIYWMKMRCATLPDAPDGRGVTRYSFKMWASGQPEPAGWDWEVDQTSRHALRQGGAALMAHHMDVTFGNVTITRLSGSGGPPPDTTPPVLSSITATPTATAATIRWTTDEPATSAVAYGPTSAYEGGTVSNATLTTTHTLSLAGLAPKTTYHYRVTSADSRGNTARSGDLVFTTPSDGGSGQPTSVFSDEFGGGALDARWRFVNPLNDAAATLADGRLRLALPAGRNHDAWYPSSTAPRVLQTIPNADFAVEAKFDAPLTQTIQGYGLVAEASDGRFVRFDLYYAGGRTFVYAALVTTSAAFTRANRSVASGTPAWLRMVRTGTRWRLFHSINGASWAEIAAFDQALPINAVGVMAGNYGSGGSAPAHTAQVDYFRGLPAGTAVPAAAPAPTFEALALGVEASGQGVVLSWSPDVPGGAFEVEQDDAADFRPLSTLHVSPYQTEHYTYRVSDLPPGTHRFRLKLLDTAAVRYSQTATVEITAAAPFVLSELRPNPFSTSAEFSLTVAEAQRVRVDAYNVLGQHVAHLLDDVLPASTPRTLRLHGTALPAGLYFIRVQGEDFTEVRRAVLAK